MFVWVLAENCMVGDLLRSERKGERRTGFSGEGLRPSRASEQVWQVRDVVTWILPGPGHPEGTPPRVHSPPSLPKGERLLGGLHGSAAFKNKT